MAKIVSGIIGLLVLVVMAGGAGWAQQREASLMGGPMSPMIERPTLVACTDDRIAKCKDVAYHECVPKCKAASPACDQCKKAYEDLCELGCK
jgi:hypothetical protein